MSILKKSPVSTWGMSENLIVLPPEPDVKLLAWIRKRRTEVKARCKCGLVLSEWFLNGGAMWCPPEAGGCGLVSPWASHEEFKLEREGSGR